MSDELLQPEPGWSAVTPFGKLGSRTSFVSGDANRARLRVRYFRRNSDSALMGKAWFGPDAEGPPGHAHGGSMAAVLDEAMGAAAWMNDEPVLARSISVEFRALLPLGHVTTLEATIRRHEGRRIYIEGRISGPDQLYAQAQGVFVRLRNR